MFVLRGVELSARLGQTGTRLGPDAAAAVVDVLRHRVHPRLRGEQCLLQRPVETFGGGLLLGDRGEQPIQFGVGLGQCGERAERIGRTAGAGGVESPARRVAGAGQIAQVRRFGFLRVLQRGVGVLDAGVDVGDQRRQGGDRVPDVVGGAVDRVE